MALIFRRNSSEDRLRRTPVVTELVHWPDFPSVATRGTYWTSVKPGAAHLANGQQHCQFGPNPAHHDHEDPPQAGCQRLGLHARFGSGSWHASVCTSCRRRSSHCGGRRYLASSGSGKTSQECRLQRGREFGLGSRWPRQDLPQNSMQSECLQVETFENILHSRWPRTRLELAGALDTSSCQGSMVGP